jgi:fatty-acyl-CoA synthase
VNVVNAPMMHGGGQWTSFINFFGGGTVVLNCDHHFDGDRVARLAAAEHATSIMVVGDAMARPLADALARPGADYDLSSVFIIGSGGAILSKAVREEPGGPAPPTPGDGPLRRARDGLRRHGHGPSAAAAPR